MDTPENKKVRLIFVGDTHLDERTPKSRKDNYLDASIEELNETLEICRRMKCDGWVHAGDVFHGLNPGVLGLNRTMETLLHDRDGKPWGFPRYATTGNHDIEHNALYMPKSAFWTLIQAGAIQVVDEVPEWRLGFGHFRSGIEKEIKDGILARSDHIVWSLHANVTLVDFFEGSSFVKLDDVVTHPDTKLLLCGHIHFPLEGKRKDGLQLVNPGSTCRNAASSFNLERQPRVAMVEYTLDGSFLRFKYVQLESSAPSDEIFRLDEIEAEKQEKSEVNAFIQQISQVTLHQEGTDNFTALKRMGQLRQVEQRVIDVALQYLERTQKKRGIFVGDN